MALKAPLGSNFPYRSTILSFNINQHYTTMHIVIGDWEVCICAENK